MTERRPMNTAPRDGSQVTVVWIDRDGQENESVARYHALDRLRKAGGAWDESDEGWWVSLDGSTRRRVEPIAWIAETEDG